MTCKQDSISILTHKNRRKGKFSVQVLPVFPHYMTRNAVKNFDCNRGVYMFCKILMRENDVTPSNIMEMEIDVTKKK